MVDADRLDLVLGPCRRRGEDAAGNFLGLVDRMLLGNRLRNLDREKFRFAPRGGGGADGVRGDLAVERTDRHERLDSRVARHLGDLVGAELRDRHLVGIDAGFGQDHAQQRDVGLRASDDADAVSGEFVEALDLRRRRFLRALRRKSGRRPQHDDVLAQDGDGFGIGRQVQIAARHRKVGFACGEQRDALGRARGCDRRQPYRAAVARKGLRHQLDQFLVVASGRADGDPQGDRPQQIVKPAGGGAEQENAGGEDQQRIVLSLPARAGWGGMSGLV